MDKNIMKIGGYNVFYAEFTANLSIFPVFSLFIRETCGDEFASDCYLHHLI